MKNRRCRKLALLIRGTYERCWCKARSTSWDHSGSTPISDAGAEAGRARWKKRKEADYHCGRKKAGRAAARCCRLYTGTAARRREGRMRAYRSPYSLILWFFASLELLPEFHLKSPESGNCTPGCFTPSRPVVGDYRFNSEVTVFSRLFSSFEILMETPMLRNPAHTKEVRSGLTYRNLSITDTSFISWVLPIEGGIRWPSSVYSALAHVHC